MADLTVDITARAGDFALDAAFEAGPGITAIFGKSGAGKSTLLRAISGLLKPASGRIDLGGQCLFDGARGINIPARSRHVGFVFQDDRLFPHMTVRNNILYGAGTADRGIGPVADLLDLEQLLVRKPATLSGGERKRVAIARALLSEPRILLMDEPLASLDHARRNMIMPYLERLRDEAGLPILYVSHEIDEVARLADTLVILSDGKVVDAGETAELFSRLDLGPALGRHEASVLLEGEIAGHDAQYDLTAVTIEGETLYLAGYGAQAVAPGTRLRLRVRARDVAISLARQPDISMRNQLPIVIDLVRQEGGAFAEIRGRIGAQYLRARVTRKTVDDLALTEGMTVYALIKTISFDRRLVQPRLGQVQRMP
jgi:molybdate transport system ATP-binding protein